MKRIVVVLAVAALMLALIAGPVAAQAESTREVFEGSYPDPETGSTATLIITCGPYAGEYALSYDYRAFITTVTKPSGDQTVKIHYLNLHGQAVNAETGRTFYFSGGSGEIHQVDFNQYAGAMVLVTRDGDVNFLSQFSVRTDTNGEPLFEHIQTRGNCPE